MNTIKCNKCNNTIPQGSAFCSFCGTKVERPCTEKACPKCNQMIPLDSEFCPFCGTRIEQKERKATQNAPFSKQTQGFETAQEKAHYNFTNLNNDYKETTIKKSTHIQIPNSEKIVLLGDIHKKTASILFLLWSSIYYVLCILLFYFTHIEEHGSSSQGISYYFLGFIEYKNISYGKNKEPYYFLEAIIIIALICILFALVPYCFFKLKRKLILQNELVLTDQFIYYYLPNEENQIKIPLNKIKSIQYKRCSWLYGAHKIIITLNTSVTHEIAGISNAHEFIQASIQAAQTITKESKAN